MGEERSYKNRIFGILVLNLLLGIPGGIGLAILSRYLEESFGGGLNPNAVALAFMIMMFHVLMKGLASPLCGYWADSRGRKFTLKVGAVIAIIGSVSLLFSSLNILLLAIAGTLIIGGARGFFMTSFNVMAGDIGEQYNRVGHAESYSDGLYLIGALVGGGLTLFLKGQSYFIFFLIALLLFALATAFLLYGINETLSSKENEQVDRKFSYKNVLKHENFVPTFMFAFTVEGAESGFIATTLPIFVATFPAVTLDKSALYTTFPFSLGLGLFFLIAGIINDRRGRKYTALLGCLFIIIFSILASFAMISPILVFVLAFLISGSSSFVRSTIESTWTDVTNPLNRGRTYGVFRFFNELGGVVHPLIMALLLFLGVPIYASAILVAIFAIISFIIGRKYFKETLKK
jgi:MFS family permease